jgi:hypothetical protein
LGVTTFSDTFGIRKPGIDQLLHNLCEGWASTTKPAILLWRQGCWPKEDPGPWQFSNDQWLLQPVTGITWPWPIAALLRMPVAGVDDFRPKICWNGRTARTDLRLRFLLDFGYPKIHWFIIMFLHFSSWRLDWVPSLRQRLGRSLKIHWSLKVTKNMGNTSIFGSKLWCWLY